MGLQHDLKVDAENGDDEEAGDCLEYSQKPPREKEILWRMRAWSQMRRAQRVRYYGEIKAHVSRSKKAEVRCGGTEECNGQSEEETRERSFDVVTYRHGSDGDWRVSLGKGIAK